MTGRRLRPQLALLAGLAACLAASACASSGAVPRPYPGERPTAESVDPDAPSRPATAPAAFAASVVEAARGLVGTPYREGGNDPEGFDCSGFVQYVFARAGRAVPRSVRELWHAGSAVDEGAVESGDLVFFAIAGKDVSHVGIAIDASLFVHAPSARGAVRVERLDTNYWRSRYAGARRIEAIEPGATSDGWLPPCAARPVR